MSSFSSWEGDPAQSRAAADASGEGRTVRTRASTTVGNPARRGLARVDGAADVPDEARNDPRVERRRIRRGAEATGVVAVPVGSLAVATGPGLSGESDGRFRDFATPPTRSTRSKMNGPGRHVAGRDDGRDKSSVAHRDGCALGRRIRHEFHRARKIRRGRRTIRPGRGGCVRASSGRPSKRKAPPTSESLCFVAGRLTSAVALTRQRNGVQRRDHNLRFRASLQRRKHTLTHARALARERGGSVQDARADVRAASSRSIRAGGARATLSPGFFVVRGGRPRRSIPSPPA